MTILAIDERSTMADEKNGSGIRVSSGALTIVLFLLADTLAGVWWASAQNEKMNTVIGNQRAQVETEDSHYREAMTKIQETKSELEEKVAQLQTYNQNLREKLAAKGLLK
jgi:septal ring factor EnvC (AmiA/AmiB activator)